MYRIFAILLILLVSMPVMAYHPEDGIDVNLILTNFDFAEFNDGGSSMSEGDMQAPEVTEKGWLYGGELEFKTTFDRIYFQANASINQGVVEYSGVTQETREDHVTNTTETIADYSIAIGRAYETWRRHDYSFIYAGIGYHQWVRDIHTKGDVAGLYEVYTWGYVSVGARGYLFRLGPVHFFGEVTAHRTLFPQMTLNSRGIYDNVKLDLGEHYGARFALPTRILLGRRFQMNIEPFFETWDLGRSEHTQLTQQNVVIGGVHEPRSATRLWGLNIGFSMRFD